MVVSPCQWTQKYYIQCISSTLERRLGRLGNLRSMDNKRLLQHFQGQCIYYSRSVLFWWLQANMASPPGTNPWRRLPATPKHQVWQRFDPVQHTCQGKAISPLWRGSLDRVGRGRERFFISRPEASGISIFISCFQFKPSLLFSGACFLFSKTHYCGSVHTYKLGFVSSSVLHFDKRGWKIHPSDIPSAGVIFPPFQQNISWGEKGQHSFCILNSHTLFHFFF